MIEIEKLSFRYSRAEVLQDLQFGVRTGEILGVIGPNGSGKSTLLRILSGLLTRYSGSVRLEGRELRSWPRQELATKIAVVPQETHPAFSFTALETVLMGRAPYLKGMEFESSEDLEIARHAMLQTGTELFADRPILELSGGEKQRVILARALAQQCPLLILDEPTAFLDIRHQAQVCDLLRRLNRDKGLTILVVFHDLNLASICCHRLLLLSQGRLFRLGHPQEVVTYSNIKAVYQAEVYVGINDLTGKPYYMPMQESS